MKAGFLITMTDGNTALLFDRKRAHGLAGHHGWTVNELTPQQAAAHIKLTVTSANGQKFKTPEETARVFGCTVEQARAQIMRCRDGIAVMLVKARLTGKKVNNYTEAQLEQIVNGYNRALA